MKKTIDLDTCVGKRVVVIPHADDDFDNEFEGTIIGVRHGLIQVRDADDDVFEVEIEQVSEVI